MIQILDSRDIDQVYLSTSKNALNSIALKQALNGLEPIQFEYATVDAIYTDEGQTLEGPVPSGIYTFERIVKNDNFHQMIIYVIEYDEDGNYHKINITISIYNGKDLDDSNRFDFFEKILLETEEDGSIKSMDIYKSPVVRRDELIRINGQDLYDAPPISIITDQQYDPTSENAQSGIAVTEAISSKQDTLISGKNIKTINGESILGSGNIEIEIPTITVDQRYASSSSNAQSGTAVAEVVAEVNTAINAQGERISNIIAHNNDTEGNTELIDIRTDCEGNVHSSAGSAIRSNIREIKDVLNFEHKTVNIIENLSNTFVYLATSQGGNSTASSAWIAYTIKTSQIPEFNKIMVSTYGGDLNKYQVAFYSDADTQNSGTFISGIAFSGNDEKETVTITELPENTQSIIITNRKTSGTDMSVILETKEFTTLLDELSEDVSTIVAELDSKYVITDLTPLSTKNAYYVPSNNTMTASSSWESYAISVADIPEFSEIEVSSHTSANNYKQIAFYSTPTPSNDSYISGIEFGSIDGKITHTITELPEDTLSILVTNRKASGTITFTSTSKEKASNVGITLNRVVDIEEHILKEQRARFDNSFNFISYSSMGVSEGDINTEEHYTWCAKQKFTSIKGDVRVSSDGKIIMCHDAGFTLDENGDVTAYNINNNTKIKTLTEAECFALKQANRGHHICGLDSLIRVCKLYGKVPYITIRDGDMDIIIPEMFRILDIYNMRKRAIINSFTYETLEKVRRFDDDIALSWVMEYNHKVTEEDIDKADVLGNCLITCFDYSGASPTKSANQSDEIIQYAKSKDIRLYEACIGYQYDLNADEIYKRGFTGAQCEMLPDIIS